MNIQLPGIVNLLINLMIVIFRLASLSVVVFLRGNFGERYFGFFGYAAAMITLQIARYYGEKIMVQGMFAKELFVFGVAAAIAGLFHFRYSYIRRCRGVIIHSRYAGTSWGIFYKIGLEHQTIQGYLEPAICVIVGAVLYPYYLFLGDWIMLAGACLFVENQLREWQFRNWMWDCLDKQLEAENFPKALEDFKRPSEIGGLFVPFPRGLEAVNRDFMRKAFEKQHSKDDI